MCVLLDQYILERDHTMVAHNWFWFFSIKYMPQGLYKNPSNMASSTLLQMNGIFHWGLRKCDVKKRWVKEELNSRTLKHGSWKREQFVQVTFLGRKCTESKTILYEGSSGKANDLLVKRAMQAEPEETWSTKSKTLELKPNEDMA